MKALDRLKLLQKGGLVNYGNPSTIQAQRYFGTKEEESKIDVPTNTYVKPKSKLGKSLEDAYQARLAEAQSGDFTNIKNDKGILTFTHLGKSYRLGEAVKADVSSVDVEDGEPKVEVKEGSLPVTGLPSKGGGDIDTKVSTGSMDLESKATGNVVSPSAADLLGLDKKGYVAVGGQSNSTGAVDTKIKVSNTSDPVADLIAKNKAILKAEYGVTDAYIDAIGFEKDGSFRKGSMSTYKPQGKDDKQVDIDKGNQEDKAFDPRTATKEESDANLQKSFDKLEKDENGKPILPDYKRSSPIDVAKEKLSSYGLTDEQLAKIPGINDPVNLGDPNDSFTKLLNRISSINAIYEKAGGQTLDFDQIIKIGFNDKGGFKGGKIPILEKVDESKVKDPQNTGTDVKTKESVSTNINFNTAQIKRTYPGITDSHIASIGFNPDGTLKGGKIASYEPKGYVRPLRKFDITLDDLSAQEATLKHPTEKGAWMLDKAFLENRRIDPSSVEEYYANKSKAVKGADGYYRVKEEAKVDIDPKLKEEIEADIAKDKKVIADGTALDEKLNNDELERRFKAKIERITKETKEAYPEWDKYAKNTPKLNKSIDLNYGGAVGKDIVKYSVQDISPEYDKLSEKDNNVVFQKSYTFNAKGERMDKTSPLTDSQSIENFNKAHAKFYKSLTHLNKALGRKAEPNDVLRYMATAVEAKKLFDAGVQLRFEEIVALRLMFPDIDRKFKKTAMTSDSNIKLEEEFRKLYPFNNKKIDYRSYPTTMYNNLYNLEDRGEDEDNVISNGELIKIINSQFSTPKKQKGGSMGKSILSGYIANKQQGGTINQPEQPSKEEQDEFKLWIGDMVNAGHIKDTDINEGTIPQLFESYRSMKKKGKWKRKANTGLPTMKRGGTLSALMPHGRMHRYNHKSESLIKSRYGVDVTKKGIPVLSKDCESGTCSYRQIAEIEGKEVIFDKPLVDRIMGFKDNPTKAGEIIYNALKGIE